MCMIHRIVVLALSSLGVVIRPTRKFKCSTPNIALDLFGKCCMPKYFMYALQRKCGFGPTYKMPDILFSAQSRHMCPNDTRHAQTLSEDTNPNQVTQDFGMLLFSKHLTYHPQKKHFVMCRECGVRMHFFDEVCTRPEGRRPSVASLSRTLLLQDAVF